MNILDFITQEELDDAPEDSSLAFTQLVSNAQSRLSAHISTLDENHYEIEEAQYRFMNIVIALAKAHKIEPFSNLEVPRYEKFDYSLHRQFNADLDHYMTQLLVDNSIRGKRDSVLIQPDVKDKIRVYIHELKLAIDNADLTEVKRANLHKKLLEFEVELEKRRLNLMAVTRFAFAILAAPGTIWGSYEVVKKLTANVMQVVGEAKAVDDENRQLPFVQAPVALLPPRKFDIEQQFDEAKTQRAFPAALDDEIPF
jgi:hypothetical protein